MDRPEGEAEMRVVDLMTGPGRHTLLVGMSPSDEPIMRWDDLDFETLHEIVDEIRASRAAKVLPLWDLSGPATTIPEG
jgi:hypothetical protein